MEGFDSQPCVCVCARRRAHGGGGGIPWPAALARKLDRIADFECSSFGLVFFVPAKKGQGRVAAAFLTQWVWAPRPPRPTWAVVNEFCVWGTQGCAQPPHSPSH